MELRLLRLTPLPSEDNLEVMLPILDTSLPILPMEDISLPMLPRAEISLLTLEAFPEDEVELPPADEPSRELINPLTLLYAWGRSEELEAIDDPSCLNSF